MKRYFILLFAMLFISCSSPKKATQESSIEQWMGVYLKSQKIGYSFYRLDKGDNNYKIAHRLKIKLTMMGNQEEVVSNYIGMVDTNFVLQNFDFSFQSTRNTFNAKGEVKQNLLSIEVKSGGSTQIRIDTLDGSIYPVASLSNLAVKKHFEIGKDYSVKIFDATVLKVIDAKIKLVGKEKITVSSKNYDVTKMTVTMLGLTTTIWFDKNGREIKEESQPGLTIIEEPREQALAQEEAIDRLDILSMFSIPIDTVIKSPRTVKYLKAEIKGINVNDFELTDNIQKVLQENPLVLEIKIQDSILTTKLPINAEIKFLQPSLCIQSDDKEIKTQANTILKQEKDGLKAVQKIMNWVYTNVEKRATASLPSALDVLKNKQGDCNEHAILFAALCRAVNIPCQICIGLVYVDGRFYYHAWNKVMLTNWISVDPTFGQMPIDATHIKFAEGELEEQAKVLKIVGEISIKILAFD